ncbi:hypothetical protein M9458_044964, partial [Cirrhinus mrigala]
TSPPTWERTLYLLWCGRPFSVELSGKRNSLTVESKLLLGGVLLEKSSSSTLFLVRLQWTAAFHNCLALVDSGAEGNFMDFDLAHRLHIPVVPLTHKITVNALNGQALPDITHTTGPVTLVTSGNHSESITLLLTPSPLAPIVLGHPWLVQHNPRVDWGHNSVSAWSDSCYASCLVTACSSVSCSLLQNESVNLSNVPEEYRDLKEVFSKSRAASLPPHHPYDCAIDLVPGTSPPKGKLYSLSAPEREAMEKYISDSLAVGFIHPSSSPAGAGFFFVGKMDGSLRPCIDYRGRNNITVKNTYPLLLMSSAFERLQGASIFTKLDLRNAYHLVRIRKGDEWKAAFNTPRGHFEYQVMPFGLQLASPLTALTSTKMTFRWSNAAEAAFTKLKSRFVSAPILMAPDPTRQFVVEVDASEVGVGAVLSQRLASDDRMHPCAFFSRRLSPAESNYDIGNRELLAVKLVLEEWCHWLEGLGVPFIVWTDHKNLEYIRSAKQLNSRQARWALFFGRFDFSISYRPGSKNIKPDALSRIFDHSEQPPSPESIIPGRLVVSTLSWEI